MKSLSLYAGLAGLLLSSASAFAGAVTVSFTNSSQVVNQSGTVL